MANRDQERERQRRLREQREQEPGYEESRYDWEWDRSFNRQNQRDYGGYYRNNFGEAYRQEHAVDRDFDRGGDDHRRGEDRSPDRVPYGEYFDPGDSFDWEEVEARQVRERSFDRPYRQQDQREMGRQRAQGYNRQPRQEQPREQWQERGPYTGMGPSNYHRSDERIAEEVCERLTEHGQIDARDIDIEVKEGKVQLTGTVNRKLEKYIAEDVIEAVSGVKDIQNDIRVTHRDQGRDRQPRTGGEIKEGMEVLDLDSERVGVIRALHGQDFRVSRDQGRDVFIPFSAIVSAARQVKINVRSGEIDRQGWRTA